MSKATFIALLLLLPAASSADVPFCAKGTLDRAQADQCSTQARDAKPANYESCVAVVKGSGEEYALTASKLAILLDDCLKSSVSGRTDKKCNQDYVREMGRLEKQFPAVQKCEKLLDDFKATYQKAYCACARPHIKPYTCTAEAGGIHDKHKGLLKADMKRNFSCNVEKDCGDLYPSPAEAQDCVERVTVCVASSN